LYLLDYQRIIPVKGTFELRALVTGSVRRDMFALRANCCPQGVHIRLHGMTPDLREHLEQRGKMGLEHATFVLGQPAIAVVVPVDALAAHGHANGFPIRIHGGLLTLGQMSD